MRERQPTTQTVKASEARQQWSELLNRVFRRQTRVIVEKSGIPVAAIISAEDLEHFHRLEAERAKDFAILDEIGEAFKDEDPAEIERQTAKAIAEVRAENLRQQAAQQR